MTKAIITAEVEDPETWEARFLSHFDLFRTMSIANHEFTTTENNEVAICSDVTDLEKYMEVFNSRATADAMASDSVKRETVKVFVLEKNVEL